MSAVNLQDTLEKIGRETDGFKDNDDVPFVWPEVVPQDRDAINMADTYVTFGFRGFPDDIHAFSRRIAAHNVFDIELIFTNKNFRTMLTQSKIFIDKFVNAMRDLQGTTLYRTGPNERFKAYSLQIVLRVQI